MFLWATDSRQCGSHPSRGTCCLALSVSDGSCHRRSVTLTQGCKTTPLQLSLSFFLYQLETFHKLPLNNNLVALHLQRKGRVNASFLLFIYHFSE